MRSYLLLAGFITAVTIYLTGCNQPEFSNEDFEQGSKTSYAPAVTLLHSGNWQLHNALLGTLPSDAKTGRQAARIKEKGYIQMLQPIHQKGSLLLSMQAGVFGSDKPAKWQIAISQDGGKTWNILGSQTTASHALQSYSFALEATADFIIRIENLANSGRLNIDNILLQSKAAGTTISTTPHPPVANRDDNLALGNPSNAGATGKDNYLVKKLQYTLSYNSSRGTANWVSWHMNNSWKGGAQRCNCFSEDSLLPASFFRATTDDYTNSGFDRGHLCPSEDRDGSDEDNAATFLMDNIIPQSPNLNQKPWERLEAYCRTLCDGGNELYIIAGSYGKGGSGRNGTRQTIANGKITVPAHCWKVIVVLPLGDNDLQRITTQTRIIAVDMPNLQSASSREWNYYRTSVDAIEKATGYDLLNKLPLALQKSLEATADKGPDR